MCTAYYQENRQRDFFIDTIRRRMIGPGGDISGFPDANELLYSSPLTIYHSGILFSPAYASESTDQDQQDENQDTEPEIFVDESHDPDGDIDNTDDIDVSSRKSDSAKGFQSDRLASHYPHFMGLVFALKPEATTFTLTITYARYTPIEKDKSCIAVTQQVYDKLLELLHEAENDEELVSIFGQHSLTGERPMLKYNPENCILSLEQIPVAVNGDNVTILNSIPRRIIGKYFTRNNYLKTILFKKLISPNIYQRKPIEFEREITVSDLLSTTPTIINIDGDNDIICMLHMRDNVSNKTIKAVLQNVSNAVAKSYKNCIFQARISISCPSFVPIRDAVNRNKDYDFRVMEYQYAGFIRYAKGMGVAADWNIDSLGSGIINTTHLPEVDIHQFSNGIRPDESEKDYKDILSLKNISIWSNYDDDSILGLLDSFITSFSDWCTAQQNMDVGDDDGIKEDLLNKQRQCLERLRHNIDYLRDNDEAMTCFKIANAAMLIQMTIAKDPRFKKGRVLSDLMNVMDRDNVYNNISFFSNYGNEVGDLSHAYRPFQLAFLLMNVRNVFYVNPAERETAVDLIWFPTGGGKTTVYPILWTENRCS